MIIYTSDDYRLLDACRYYYFGRAFEIMSSKKMKLEVKRIEMKALLDELHKDPFLNNRASQMERDSIISLLFDKLQGIELAIKAKKSKTNVRYSFFQGDLVRAVMDLFKKKR